MSTYDVPRPAPAVSLSPRGRLLAVAVAVAIVLALVIAGVTAASTGGSGTPSPVPQQRDLAPTQFRDPQTHALLWVRPTNASQPAGSTPQLLLRPRYPGK
jgi:hypothetical protein